MHAEILHLSGPARGSNETHRKPRLRLGTAADADVVLPDGAPYHAEVAFHEAECAFYLRRLEGRVFVNQREVTEVILDEGDLIELGEGGSKLRFHIGADQDATRMPTRQMLRDAKDHREIRGIFGFLGSLAVEAARRVGWMFTFAAAVYNLVRIRNLCGADART